MDMDTPIPSGDPVQAYLQKYGGPPMKASVPPPVAAPDPVASYLQKYGAQKPASDPNLASGVLGTIQKGAEGLISGIPGAERAVAGYRGILSLLGGNGIDAAANEVQNTISNARQHVASIPTVARIPLQMVGAAPVASALAPLGLLGGGAAFGAAAGADQDASSLTDRAKNAALGAALGAAGAKGSQLLGKGITNVAERTGLADALGNAIKNISPKLAATIGTEGQVNSALSDRQSVLDNVGESDQTAGKTQLDRVNTTKAQAKVLYDQARNDTQIIQDPELQQLLSDPQVQKAYQAASSIRAASGNPLQKVAAPDQVPLALQKMGVSQERYAELQALNTQGGRVPVVSGTDVLPPELMGASTSGVEMPDPDVLAKTKRYLMDAAQGQNSPLAIKQDEAQALLPKIDALRAKLHQVSPDWQQADAFYAAAKGQEEAYADGLNAYAKSGNQTGDNITSNSPEAMLQAIQQPRYPGEPAGAQQARADAFRQGVKDATISQIKDAPVDRGIASILQTNALRPGQTGMQTRHLMFDAPDQSSTLEGLLAKLRGESNVLPSANENGQIPVSPQGIRRYLLRNFFHSPDLIERPAGQSLLTQRLLDPTALQQGVSDYQSIAPGASSFLKGIATTLGAQAAR